MLRHCHFLHLMRLQSKTKKVTLALWYLSDPGGGHLDASWLVLQVIASHRERSDIRSFLFHREPTVWFCAPCDCHHDELPMRSMVVSMACRQSCQRDWHTDAAFPQQLLRVKFVDFLSHSSSCSPSMLSTLQSNLGFHVDLSHASVVSRRPVSAPRQTKSKGHIQSPNSPRLAADRRLEPANQNRISFPLADPQPLARTFLHAHTRPPWDPGTTPDRSALHTRFGPAGCAQAFTRKAHFWPLPMLG